MIWSNSKQLIYKSLRGNYYYLSNVYVIKPFLLDIIDGVGCPIMFVVFEIQLHRKTLNWMVVYYFLFFISPEKKTFAEIVEPFHPVR